VSDSGSVSDQRGAASVGDSRVRERHAARDPSFRVPPTNSLTLTLSPTRHATRDPRAGPAGGPQFPDKL
jgi:hypothetical protein